MCFTYVRFTYELIITNINYTPLVAVSYRKCQKSTLVRVVLSKTCPFTQQSTPITSAWRVYSVHSCVCVRTRRTRSPVRKTIINKCPTYGRNGVTSRYYNILSREIICSLGVDKNRFISDRRACTLLSRTIVVVTFYYNRSVGRWQFGMCKKKKKKTLHVANSTPRSPCRPY